MRNLENKKLYCFVCTGNTCRSPMAEALFNTLAKEKHLDSSVKAVSAGLFAVPFAPMNPLAKQALMKRGIVAETFASTQMDRALFVKSDVILTMEKSQAHALEMAFGNSSKVFTLKAYAGSVDKGSALDGEDIADPYGLDEAVYEQTLKQIEVCVQRIIDHCINQ